MTSAICTLYEGHYHHGVAALSNSLFRNGFRGSIYVGYRGVELPPWANKAIDNPELKWENAKSLRIVEGLELHFLPVVTCYHLTNYKPDFMLELWDGPAKDAESMFYVDPDIILIAPFIYLQEWINCGVALCEDINSPLQEFHPRRVSWRHYYKKYDIELNFKNQIYVNGGFIGVLRKDIDFLRIWKIQQEVMSDIIGGLNRSGFKNGDQLLPEFIGDFSPFGNVDQDALNTTIEVYKGKISFMGKEAMGFCYGVILLPHAVGQRKPWLIKPFIDWMLGLSPRIVDKEFWKNTKTPIQSFSSKKIVWINFQIKITSFLGRIYSKH
jgi:hypothetical protein